MAQELLEYYADNVETALITFNRYLKGVKNFSASNTIETFFEATRFMSNT